MDSSDVGRFGTLRLMKRLEPHKVIASYPIDEEEINVGRDPSCSIRLYYDSVSGLHCKIIFRERKAFLVVLGTNGLLIDGCPVFPSTGPGGSPVTVPLPNNSMIEINKKCFQFSYPPKELRAALIDTPTRPDEITPDKKRRRRTLRLSMIQSAQVFTPRPSHDPRENLRILKTPIKTPFSRFERRQSSPLKRGMYIPEEEEEEEEEEDIVLVQTNHPKVVEEDRDLVILEHVTVEVPEPEPMYQPSPQRTVQFPLPQTGQQPMQTPQRRRQPRSSLHKAVLIRSAQRTAMKVEMEREEEREVEEVEETIQALPVMEELREVDDEHEEEAEMDYGDEDEDIAEEQVTRSGPFSGLRKSLGLVTGWAFGQGFVPRDVQEQGDEDEEQIQADDDELPAETPTPEPEEEDAMDLENIPEDEEPDAVAPLPPRSPVRARPLGKFMTPQAQRISKFGGSPSKNRTRNHARYSVGGFTPGGIHGTPVVPVMVGNPATSGARRVRLVEPWRVEDIMVPVADAEEAVDQEEDELAELSMRSRSVTMSPSKKIQVSEQERRAILDRRRSALTAPDTFFGGEIPGSRRLSLFPPTSPMKSPAKSPPLFAATSTESAQSPSEVDAIGSDESSRQEDSQVLLARMKQMVEGVKRRQSMGPRPSAATTTPKKSGFSLLAPDAGNTPIKQINVGGEEDEQDISDKENNAQEADVVSPDTGHEAEDVDMVVLPDDVHEPKQVIEPETPALDGLKHMLGVPREDVGTPSFQGIREMLVEPTQLATPQMDGIRQLFHQARVIATPAFEGVGEMLEPPAGWETRAEDEQPAEKERQPSAKAPLRRLARPAGAANAAAVRRTASGSATSAKPTPKTNLSTVNKDEPSSSNPLPAAARVVRRPARGKPAESEDETEQASGPKPVRRTTRKASESPVPEPAPSATKNLRKPRGAKTPTPTPEDPPSKSTASSRRRAKTPIPEVEEEDSAARPGSPEADETNSTASKVRRSTRGKLTSQVKEEHENDTGEKPKPAPARLFAPRALRGRRPVGLAATSSVPRSGARSVNATSATKKATPASAKGGADATPVIGNKENTPEPQDTPAADDPPQASSKSASKSAAKTKVTRSVGKTRAASEDVGDKEAVDPAKSRVSRARTRTAGK